MNNLFNDSSMELFNSGWNFKAPQSDEFCPIELPHSWNAEGWTYEPPKPQEPVGIGVYEKHIDGKTYKNCRLKFEGVSIFAEVFINGIKAAENIGAHKSFTVELDNLIDGDNIISVRVTDKPSVTLLPEGCDDVFTLSPRYKRWPVGYGSSLEAGGIWRNVYVQKPQRAYLKPFIIVSNGKGFDITADLCGDYENCSIAYEIYDENSKLTGSKNADCDTFSLYPENPVLSWPLKPHIYTFKAELKDGDGNVIQTITQPAYIMNFAVRNSSFRLNNKPYYLRGQNGFPHCNIAYGKEYIEKYVDMVCQQGVEISRFHTEPPSHEWLDECDRRGVMVILEMPLHGSFGCYSYGSEEFCKNALSETLDIVKEYRRHPSIVLWSMGNELIVSVERDAGLGKPIFDVLEGWIYEVRKLDGRPVISNSNGDAANIVNKTVGDVDDVHQYGGWYVENIYDLRHFGEYTNRNDMLFQPCISTESIAGYTNNDEEFFVRNTDDIRQKKIVDMRIGEIDDLPKQSREYQGFLLKEYAEAMWRLRVEGSSFSGYIPFGQYTWFFNPFDKDKIAPKYIWSVYNKVMMPVHIQLECFDRKLEENGYLKGKLGLWNEDVHLSENPTFEVVIKNDGKVLDKKTYTVKYHKSVFENVEIGPLSKTGKVEFEVYYNGEMVSHNDIAYMAYAPMTEKKYTDCVVYDPENMLDIDAKRIDCIEDIVNCSERVLCVGPYSLDDRTLSAAPIVNEWMKNGGKVIVLEQNPGYYAEDIFGTGLSSSRVCQPQWSRWSMNLVKHTDRADICCKEHKMFDGIEKADMFWWNGDTFLADSYIYRSLDEDTDIVLSHIGNGLSDGELMPVKYEYKNSGHSITAIERKIGNGSILFTSLLIGTKHSFDPVAKRILDNLLK